MDSALDVIDALTALTYSGNCLQNDVLTEALKVGTPNREFRQLVYWLTQELHVLRKTDEVITELEDLNEFTMELSALLKELGCPYEDLVAGPLSERFESYEARMQLLDFLISELMATKMTLHLHPEIQGAYIIPKIETNTARALQQLSEDLGLTKPPDNVAPKAFFDKLNFKVEEQQRAVKPGVLSDALLHTPKQLTAAQWKKLEEMHADLDTEYNLRRQMLLTRLEVTIQSFQWADKMQKRENEIIERFERKLLELEKLRYGGSDTNIIALLAARSDLAIIEKTSSANVRKNTGSKIQKHIIGSVPDRGGRAYEHAPPPPEMPSWQQNRASGPSGGRGGFGGGNNFRGGRGGGGGNNYRGERGGGNSFRGDRGGGGGGNNTGGNAGHWQQFSTPQHQQQQQYQPQQHQQYRPPQQEQRVQYGQERDQNWVSGSGRVQGTGWSQQGNGDSRGSGNFGRGRSNYNRGGGQRR